MINSFVVFIMLHFSMSFKSLLSNEMNIAGLTSKIVRPGALLNNYNHFWVSVINCNHAVIHWSGQWATLDDNDVGVLCC